MEDRTTSLPWEALQHSEGNIPREALFEFAAALVKDDSLTGELLELYEQAYESEYDYPHYEDLYVPAIFAIAAPQLSDDRRRRIGAILIENLVDAGIDEAELSMEVLSAACGSMGPVILPAVLDAIENELDANGAWIYLWGLTELAAQTENPELRHPVIKACTDLLQNVLHNEVDPLDAIEAAWTLAKMKCTDSIGLLKRLQSEIEDSFALGDYADALDLMQGRLDYTLSPRIWELPVMEWLESRWSVARDWFINDEPEYHEHDEQAAYQRAQELVERFMASNEAAALDEEVLDEAGFIASAVLRYAWDYIGCGPEKFDEFTLAEILLELLPRKVTADRACFEKVAPVTAVFLSWLESEGILADTAELAETVRSWSDKIVANGMNPALWGMAKSLYMQAKAEGVDIADEESMQGFISGYNRRLSYNNRPDDDTDTVNLMPTLPIVEHSPKIGRNQPCPCGSGKKYKKCCGGVKNANVHD